MSSTLCKRALQQSCILKSLSWAKLGEDENETLQIGFEGHWGSTKLSGDPWKGGRQFGCGMVYSPYASRIKRLWGRALWKLLVRRIEHQPFFSKVYHGNLQHVTQTKDSVTLCELVELTSRCHFAA